MQNGTVLAALDLGSNSFRLEIGRLDHGQIERIDYLKETVRQGGELNSDGLLSQQGMQKGWDCLARFAERLEGIPLNQIRAVATQTLREAKNKEVFLQKAQDILGFPVDVISGKEEARLIYSGVVQTIVHQGCAPRCLGRRHGGLGRGRPNHLARTARRAGRQSAVAGP